LEIRQNDHGSGAIVGTTRFWLNKRAAIWPTYGGRVAALNLAANISEEVFLEEIIKNFYLDSPFGGPCFWPACRNTSLVGNVTDPSGALVGGANMVAVNQARRKPTRRRLMLKGLRVSIVKAGTYDHGSTERFRDFGKDGWVVPANRQNGLCFEGRRGQRQS
jgi:hypothetical protein